MRSISDLARLLKALTEQPDDPELAMLLGDAYEDEGEMEAAWVYHTLGKNRWRPLYLESWRGPPNPATWVWCKHTQHAPDGVGNGSAVYRKVADVRPLHYERSVLPTVLFNVLTEQEEWNTNAISNHNSMWVAYRVLLATLFNLHHQRGEAAANEVVKWVQLCR